MKAAAHMKPGEKGVVKDFTDEHLSIKLLEMGVLPGTALEMKYIAPLGSPVCLRVSGYDLSLRREEAETIILL